MSLPGWKDQVAAALSAKLNMIENTTPVKIEELPKRQHHSHGPSRMNYIEDCAAFTSKDGNNDAAEEGTFLHEIMDEVIQRVITKKEKRTLPQIDGWVGTTHDLTDDQKEYLRFCCRKLDHYISKSPDEIHSETKVETARRDGKELNYGYLDVFFVFNRVKMGVVVDFKFGWLPVRPAQTNLQGKNYVAGYFQKFKTLERIAAVFIQPKLNVISEFIFHRTQMFDILKQLEDIVQLAIDVQEGKHLERVQPGKYCDYCALAGTCTKLNEMRGAAASAIVKLPQPPSFNGLELHKPEDLALARYWVDIIETGLAEVKAKAMEAAQANGGELTCTLPDGRVISYEVKERKTPRSLGSAPEVAEALQDFITPQEVLAAADLKITTLETITKKAMVEIAKARGEKLSQKAAWEQISGTLEALGLLTQGEGRIQFLTLKKTQKQIEEKESK